MWGSAWAPTSRVIPPLSATMGATTYSKYPELETRYGCDVSDIWGCARHHLSVSILVRCISSTHTSLPRHHPLSQHCPRIASSSKLVKELEAVSFSLAMKRVPRWRGITACLHMNPWLLCRALCILLAVASDVAPERGVDGVQQLQQSSSKTFSTPRTQLTSGMLEGIGRLWFLELLWGG